jgi:hypothetical protein
MGVSGAGAGRQEDVYRIVRGCGDPTAYLGRLSGSPPSLLSAPAGTEQRGQLRVLCYQYGGESESGLKPVGSPDNWRCIALDKLRSVEVLTGLWRTAPNHSRPASCIVDATFGVPDVDAEGYPERDPQQRQ